MGVDGLRPLVPWGTGFSGRLVAELRCGCLDVRGLLCEILCSKYISSERYCSAKGEASGILSCGLLWSRVAVAGEVRVQVPIVE